MRVEDTLLVLQRHEFKSRSQLSDSGCSPLTQGQLVSWSFGSGHNLWDLGLPSRPIQSQSLFNYCIPAYT